MVFTLGLGLIFSANVSELDNKNNSKNETKLYTQSIKDILPTKIELGTEWELSDFTYIVKDHDANTPETMIGIYDHIKTSTKPAYHIQSGVSKFDSINELRENFEKNKKSMYATDVFEEWEPQISNSNCYGVIYSNEPYPYNTFNIICAKDNLYYFVNLRKAVDEYEINKKIAEDFANLISNKID